MIKIVRHDSWRTEVSSRAGLFRQSGNAENHRHSRYGKIFLRKFGCVGCPYRSSADCPYGIGVDRYSADVKVWGGIVTHKAGDVKEIHPKGICPEREYELSEQLKMCCSLDGLRQKRAESLSAMEHDIGAIRKQLDQVLAKQGMLLNNPDSGMTDVGETDKQLVTLMKEFIQIHHKYHEKLDSAILQESKFKESNQSRLSTDQLNENLKLASGRIIDVTPEKEA